MKQIFVVVILLGIAYGVSFLASDNKRNNYLSSGGEVSNEKIDIKVGGTPLVKIDREKMLAQINSLDEKTRKEMLYLLGFTE